MDATLTSLIEVLEWLRDKVGDVSSPTHCENEELVLCGGYDSSDFTVGELEWLNQRGFIVSEELDGALVSFYFGSA